MNKRAILGIFSTAIQERTTPNTVCAEIELTIKAAMRSDVQLPHYIEIRKLAHALGRWPSAPEAVEHFASLPDPASLFVEDECLP